MSPTSRTTYILSALVIFTLSMYVFLSSPPSKFPTGSIMTIEEGQSLTVITSNLYKAHVISSPLIFRSTVILLGGEKRVIAGDYLLDHPETSSALAFRLVRGLFHLQFVKITIPEGWNVFQISDYLKAQLSHMDSQKFLELAKPSEGYLFPDTYFVSPILTPEKLIARMKANFTTHIAFIHTIKSSPHSLSDTITMASIIEGEAATSVDRKIVAGILWKRITLGMPLQVDSPFLYINGKTTYELTQKDLQINSPYNTYLHTGLPPGPINNPGVDSITAASQPSANNYLYFFSGRDGVMHYAKTFAEHKKNIATFGGK